MNILAYLFLIIIVLGLGFILIRNIHKETQNEITKRGVISGLITGIIHIVYLFTVHIITDGEFFIYYNKTNEIINGFSFTAFKYIGVILAALVPIILCRVNNIKEFFKYILLAILCCCAVYAFECIITLFCFNILINFPLCSWDAMFLALKYFPAGSLLGTFIAIIINLIFHLKKRENTGNI